MVGQVVLEVECDTGKVSGQFLNQPEWNLRQMYHGPNFAGLENSHYIIRFEEARGKD